MTSAFLSPLSARIGPVLALIILVLTVGCSGKSKPPPQQDTFFEKWQVMSDQSHGHSPTHEPKRLTLEETEVGRSKPIVTGRASERELPTTPVTLRFHMANVVAVIQAMARAAEQSVMISPAVTGMVTVNIRNAPWGQAFKGILLTSGLTYVWEGNIIRVLTPEDMATDLRIAEMTKKRLTQRVETEKIEPPILSVIKMKYAKAEGLRDEMEKLLSKDSDGNPIGSVQVDEETNSLIVMAIKPDVERLVKLSNRLDRPRKQIHIKAHIVEATRDTARSLGIQWGGIYKYSPGSWNGKEFSIFPGASAGQPILGTGDQSGTGINFPAPNFPSEKTGAGAALGLAFGSSSARLEVQLQALEADNKINILSSPSISTLDNEKAVTENGAKVPYVTTENSGGVLTRTVSFVDAVLRLEIEPQVIDEDTLRVRVLVKKDEPDESRAVDGNPYIIKKNTETTLIIDSGETIVISGLSKMKETGGEEGIPEVKDIPMLGWLFKSRSKSKEMEEVLIFITPTILAQRMPGKRQLSMEEIEAQLEAKRKAEIEKALREAQKQDQKQDPNSKDKETK